MNNQLYHVTSHHHCVVYSVTVIIDSCIFCDHGTECIIKPIIHPCIYIDEHSTMQCIKIIILKKAQVENLGDGVLVLLYRDLTPYLYPFC